MADFQEYNSSTHLLVRLEDDWNNLLDHGLEKTADVIVRINGSYYEAIQGGGASGCGTILAGGINAAGGVSGTNPAAVLNSAFSYAAGGVCFIRAGTYTCASALTAADCSIAGVYGKTILAAADNLNATLLTLGSAATQHSYLAVDDIFLEGNYLNQAGTSYGLKVVSIYEPSIRRVMAHGWLTGGILIDGSPTRPTILAWVDKCLVEYNGGNGITVSNSAWDTMVTNCNIGGNLGTAIDFTGTGDGLKVFGNSIWYNNKGVSIVQTLKFAIADTEFDSNMVADIYIKNSHHGSISNCQFYGCSQDTDSTYPSIILETDSALDSVDTQNIKINDNRWFKEPHTLTDITGASQSVGDHKATYCVQEINTGVGADTNFNWLDNNDFYEYATAPALIVGDGTRRVNCYPETQNCGKSQAVANGVTFTDVSFWVAEPNTNYIVTVIPDWGTTVFITNKAVGGFRANWGTASGAANTFDFYTQAMP